MKRWGTRLHAAIYRSTGGRLFGRVGGQPVLLLETVGRRTGRRRTTPVQYLVDDDMFVVVASNAGAARPPAWYLNLRANPHARIRVGARSVDVRAQEPAGQERAKLWRRLTAANRYLERAARKAGRDLPLVALVPTTPPPRSQPPTVHDDDG
jgi:deazaflavin-dependent oxidoreductase (nitroreductase family)